MIPFTEISHAITDAVATLERHGHAAEAAILRVHGPELMRLARHAAGHPDRADAEPQPSPATAPTEAIVNPARLHG